MDVRKFEIDLYWKRAAYFWAFIGVSLAAYIAALTAKIDAPAAFERSDAIYAIAMVGLVFSVAWLLVNRASKFWQRNWEFQADILEDKAIGPIYKTVFADAKMSFFSLTCAYPFSVSSINIILSAFVVVLFFLLAVYSLPCLGLTAGCGLSTVKGTMTALAAMFIFLLVYSGRSGTLGSLADEARSGGSATATARFVTRTVDIKGEITRPERPS